MRVSRVLSLCCAGLGVVVWAGLSAGCSSVAHAQKPQSAASAPNPAIPPNADYTVATVSAGRITRHLRVEGMTQAVHDQTIRIPRIRGGGYSLVLVSIVPSGTMVQKGEVMATFDDTVEVQTELAAKASYDGFVHQVANQKAVNIANLAQRAATLKQAETALGTAKLELEKGPILDKITAGIDQVDVTMDTADVASIEKQNALQNQADAAQLQVLELQRDQQEVNWERAESNVQALTIRAPISGMVGLVPVFQADGMAPAQPGEQLHSGQAMIRIFDPTNMEVDAQINEADDATLTPGMKGTLSLDAYPGISLPVHLLTASPVAVAAGGFGNPVRTFSALFHVDASNSKLLPDLSAAIDLTIASPQPELLVPRASVHFAQNQPFVTKLAADGKWVHQNVVLGNFDSQQVAIVHGLLSGDQVQVPAEIIGEGEPE